jgi:hypothetical protein
MKDLKNLKDTGNVCRAMTDLARQAHHKGF